MVAASRHVTATGGGSIRKFVQTARRPRTIHIRACGQLLNAEDRSRET